MRDSHPYRVAIGVATALLIAASMPLTVEGRQLIGSLPGVTQIALASSYVVQAGDTLYGIATRNGISAKDIPGWIGEVARLNSLDDPDMLRVGEKLQLPEAGGRSDTAASPAPVGATVAYTVQSGDTLTGIGSKLGVSQDGLSAWIANVVKANSLASADALVAGQQLRLPSSASGVAPIPSAAPLPGPAPALSIVSQPYTVEPGDTLRGIADKMNVPDGAIQEWIASVVKLNGLPDPDTLVAGKEIRLPSSGATPAADSQVAPPPPAATASVSYTIQPGDTLFSIGEKLGISGDRLNGWVTQVLTLSGIASTDLLHEGQVIQIPVSEDNAGLVKAPQPNGSRPASSGTMDYTVQSGDTLSAIGDKIGITEDAMAGWVSQVVDLNGLASGNMLTVGQHLTLPRPAGPPPSPGGTQTATGPDTATSESSCFYTVRAGDSWTSIAAKLGIAERNFQAWVQLVTTMNGIDPTLLPVGDALRLPC